MLSNILTLNLISDVCIEQQSCYQCQRQWHYLPVSAKAYSDLDDGGKESRKNLVYMCIHVVLYTTVCMYLFTITTFGTLL